MADLTTKLRAEYERMYAAARIRPERRAAVMRVSRAIADNDHWPRYQTVSQATGVPAHMVGILHSLECGLDFGRHLHNGDPLTARTVHVPKGRPWPGRPPFSWEASAADALQGLHTWTDWSLSGLAFTLEGYNGWGYRIHGNVSPYLWSYTTAYTRGKYVSDGHFDPHAISQQPGAMALLLTLGEVGKPYPGVNHG
jgi:lysozyme family protein